ncbi:MAG TPA: IS5 family transposase [Verrucomicrobiota bacterium]|nr:IS5 family transposase [Verrucomicrobiota bacterium]HOX62015.1 IS5 family transposase [Verrucomicrobiota bacterium]HPI64407.1 IS5 family transposase [Verrucomicrobiota bacterium]
MPSLSEQLDPRQPLKQLAEAIPWSEFESAFGKFYSEEGRPAKPVRLMVGLLLLKQMFNQGDETVVAAWVQNPYWQYFCGMREFQWQLPCDPSDLVYFRQRIGEAGMQRILKVSVQLHGDQAQEPEVVVDTTVQEKNITYPTDSKLAHKIIRRCWKLADRHGVKLRRRYRKAARYCVRAQRWRRDRRKRKLAHRALRKLKVIAGRLIRELERKLPESVCEAQQANFALYRRVLKQQPADRDKIYSLHEPQVYCLSKGKEHKKYEFGSKASVVMTKRAGVIVGAVAHEANLYDGDALSPALEQTVAITGQTPSKAIVDRGYRGRKTVNGTEVLVPDKAKAGQSKYVRAKMRARFRRRAAIEPLIGHLKGQYRLARCFLKGFVGDQVNLLLAAAAWNLRKWLRVAALFRLQLLRALVLPVELRCCSLGR